MTEPWHIHVCPVHGQRTPNTLGDCPVGCCAEVMEVVRVVRDTRGDGVDVLRHWLAYADKEKPPLAVSPVWAGSEESAEKWREIGARVEGPFVLESAGAVEAIHRLNVDWGNVRRNCGDPKCEGDCRWVSQLEEATGLDLGGQSTAGEAFEQSSGGETLEEAQARQLRGEHAFSPQPDTRGATDDSQAPPATRGRDMQSQAWGTHNTQATVKRITASSPERAADEANVAPGGYALVVAESDAKRFDRAKAAPLEEKHPDGNPLAVERAA
jgi:hypothetical protein